MSDRHCGCGQPTRDNAYVCESCLNLLSVALGEVPWLEEQLEISLTKQRASNLGGSGATSQALPWNERASQVKRDLANTLSTWVRAAHEEAVRGNRKTLPTNSLTSMSRWLLDRVDGMAWWEAGWEASEDIQRAHRAAMTCVTYKRASKLFLGRCDALLPHDDTCTCTCHYDERFSCDAGDCHAPTICGGSVYCEEGAELGECAECGATCDAHGKRDAIHQALDAQLFTAAEIANLSPYLGLTWDREKVRKLVNKWASRGRLLPGGHDHEASPRYRYGEVRVLLMQADSTRRSTG